MKKEGLYLLGILLCAGCSTPKEPVGHRVGIPFMEHDFIPDAVVEKAVWQMAPQAVFSRDWKDREAFPDYRTEVRLCWSSKYLYVLWIASYDELHTYADAEEIGRGESWELWKGDVVELFIGDSPDRNRYFEFVASPTDQWIDIRHNKNLPAESSYDTAWESGWKRATCREPSQNRWIAEWRIPLGAITTHRIGAGLEFQGNFYRISGQSGRELYLAWSPTMSTEKPSFHIPERFGTFVLQGKQFETRGF